MPYIHQVKFRARILNPHDVEWMFWMLATKEKHEKGLAALAGYEND